MELGKLMEFDHVIQVHDDGSVTDGPDGVHAPTLQDERLDDPAWSFFSAGYTAQHAYRGPIMHNSELIGGKLAEDILSIPGIYVAVVANWSPEDGDCADECDCDVEGWAVVRLTAS